LVGTEAALSGFASPATISVGAMLVVSAGLRETGALDALGRMLLGAGRHGLLLLLTVVVLAAFVSAFVSNTATVAVLMPLVLLAARRKSLSPSRLLIPLSYASQFGGVCTLVGTSTNLLVDSLARNGGHRGFGMFEFAPLGLSLLAIGSAYLALTSWWLLPKRRAPGSLEEDYALREYLFALRVAADSPLVGHASLAAAGARASGATLVEIQRGTARWLPAPMRTIGAGDVLVIEGSADTVLEMARHAGLHGGADLGGLAGDGLQLAEVVVAPGARCAGLPLRAIDASWLRDAVPLAAASAGRIRHAGLGDLVLQPGDALLLLLRPDALAALREDRDFVLLTTRDNPIGRHARAPLAVGIAVAVVASATLGVLPLPIAALFGAVAMVATRCLGSDSAYRALDLRVLLLIAAMVPLGLALQATGAARSLVDAVVAVLPAQPLVVLATVYGLTMLLTEVVSNAATAALMTPIALALAHRIGIDPTPLLVAVAFAASTSFSTPIGYQTNTIVYNAGGYEFRDFLRIGVPLNLLFWAASVWLIPRFFPFQ
ncbi:MAG TPA: SLC13 family permease, partial [Xanthomonadales bacterium]|nr:SLC13 family permease [Xanthomonadales bacterium]